jgi:cytochrome c biogenesis protein
VTAPSDLTTTEPSGTGTSGTGTSGTGTSGTGTSGTGASGTGASGAGTSGAKPGDAGTSASVGVDGTVAAESSAAEAAAQGADTALTTSPEAARAAREAVGGPGRPGGGTANRVGRARPVVVLSRAWRQLTSMRTALLLLFLLALAAVPGSLIPQKSLNPLNVQQYFADHPTLAPILDKFSLFSVFSAPWFAAIYLLLFISLIGCLSSRVRLHAKALLMRPPKAPARPSRLAGGARWSTSATPQDAVEAARTTLRGRRFRVAVAPAGTTRADGSPDHSVAAEKGYLRETGNLVFHVALVLLLAGVGLGSWFGYQGTVLLVTGDGFTNSVVSYDQFSHGRLVKTNKLTPFSINLDSFHATYQPNAEPKSFAAGVTYTTSLNGPKRHDTIEVNHPLRIGSAKVYLIGHGYAPHFVLRDAKGAAIWDSYTACTPRDAKFTSSCTVKIGDTGLPDVGSPKAPQQFAFTGVFTPTTTLDPAQGYVSSYPADNAPGMTINAWVGNLHIDDGVPQNVYALDTTDMKQVKINGPIGTQRIAQVLAVDNPKQNTISGLPGGYSLSVDSVREFATFQTKSDPYKGWVLVAAIAIVAGLVTSLRVRRRRVWVRVRPAGAGEQGPTVVEVGGLTRADPEGFAAELATITSEIRAGTPAPAASAAPPDPSARALPAGNGAASRTTDREP